MLYKEDKKASTRAKESCRPFIKAGQYFPTATQCAYALTDPERTTHAHDFTGWRQGKRRNAEYVRANGYNAK